MKLDSKTSKDKKQMGIKSITAILTVLSCTQSAAASWQLHYGIKEPLSALCQDPGKKNRLQFSFLFFLIQTETVHSNDGIHDSSRCRSPTQGPEKSTSFGIWISDTCT